MRNTVVTVICLCHNQKGFVWEALQSVVNQTHPSVQIIVVDDASTDGSKEVIREFVLQHPQVIHIDITENIGNCKAFNRALPFAKGEYLVDLAADDVLLPNRIEVGLQAFSAAPPETGIHFGDAELIDASGCHLSFHSDRFPHASIPQGLIYSELIERYFICSPTMLFKKEVIGALQGYDESLSYEDFDFWIRSSRSYAYMYSPKVLVKKRMLKRSLSSRQFVVGSKHQHSTFRVCAKIQQLNKYDQEKKALEKRIRYEMRVNFRLLNWWLCWKYFLLLMRNKKMQYDRTT